jgi:Ca-activated chloride channel family protein
MSAPRRKVSLVMVGALSAALQTGAQQNEAARYRVDVNLVALTFTVSDARGHPVHGLKVPDIVISEDGIPQKIAAFAEGSGVAENALPGIPAGTAVFILFDTSDRMYGSIPYVRDAIAEFIRKLDPADAVAVYTFSRNLLRAAPLTRDRVITRAGLAENVSAGDDTALFNCLLLTLRDAARVPGRKAVVVFSNGGDNRSFLSPEDVGTVAVNEGIPVYIVSTPDAGQDGAMAAALERLTSRTGGKLYQARGWQRQAEAFTEIREQIGGSYTAYYYPTDDANTGFRQVKIALVSAGEKKYTIRSRGGYQAPSHLGAAR